MLDGFPEVDDRPPMTDSQIKTAGRRLVLGISNVGFWVLLSATGIAWLAPSNGRQVQQAELFQWLLAAVAIQSLFDWVGGAVLVPASFDASRGFLSRWGRGILVHSLLLGGAGVLNYWSFHLSGGYGLGVAVPSIALFLFRRQVFCLLSGTRVRLAQIAGTDCWIAQAEDPSFTGGICGAGKNAVALLPEAWTLRLTGSELNTLRQRRLWEIQKQWPARAFLFVLCWNLAGCGIGSALLEIPGRAPETALLLHCCGMTLWGFVGLLVLPTLSRSAVFAADRSAAVGGCDVAGWIQKFPEITGEDGNAKTLLQRVFYPIPSARERLLWLGRCPALPVVGNVARMNLFLSLATLTLLGRCVHCNVGRPELWVFAPSD